MILYKFYAFFVYMDEFSQNARNKYYKTDLFVATSESYIYCCILYTDFTLS